jgi:hypothetical protein
MGAGSKDSQVSSLLVDESFATEDDQFVDRLRAVTGSKYLAALADRWKKDPRPWARRQIFRYLALPLDQAGHHPLVKRLFKHAEASRDDELMGAFLVAFDRLVRRQRRTVYRWNFPTSQPWYEEVLFVPRDQILAAANGPEARNPRTGKRIHGSGKPRLPKRGRLFSHRTRGYLRRRACRYFRRLGYQQPAEYPLAVAKALALYRDDDVASGENILDNWSLMCIAFRKSRVLEFKRTRVDMIDGRSLGELAAAPQFDDLWKQPESAEVLLVLVTMAWSWLVRVWAIQLLKRDHATALKAITAHHLLTLLDHSNEEVQQFGSGLLETLQGVDTWPIAVWLQLLETRSVTALATICQAMNQRVSPERLSLDQCVALACARATPVARMGLSWLKSRSLAGLQDRARLGRLAGARCEAVGALVAEYALSILGSPQAYRMEDVSPFFDSLNVQVRRGAWDWLTPSSPGYEDAALWSRLLETPYDEVRLRLVEELDKRTRRTAGPTALARHDLAMVWTTVLLGVHRGGRAKLRALKQISEAIAAEPDRAERLVPVLAVAIRSVRPPEARAGLSAILSAVAARPELEATLARWIPELRLSSTGVAP